MPEGAISRWSRRIVHPRLTLTTSDPGATLREVEVALRERGFRTTTTGDGFSARRRPWLSWLAASPASSCVLLVEPTSPSTVAVDVEDTGNHPAPDKVAEALSTAVGRLSSAGVDVSWGEWEAVA
jgi:hypothetical protein